jgi:hypothetical protein
MPEPLRCPETLPVYYRRMAMCRGPLCRGLCRGRDWGPHLLFDLTILRISVNEHGENEKK